MRSPLIALVALLIATTVRAQDVGRMDVAVEGQYLGGTAQPANGLSGVLARSAQFIPHLGLLTLVVEGAAADRFRTGTIIGSLQDVRARGWRWDFLGGDFQLRSTLESNPFVTIYSPDITGRGALVVARRTNTIYQLFAGDTTALGGLRIPVRVLLPQRLFGGTVLKMGSRWQLAARYLRLSTDRAAFAGQPAFYAPSRQFRQTDTVTIQSSYRIAEHLQIFSELSPTYASTLTSSDASSLAISGFAGSAWETSRLTVRANYLHQGAAYLPLFGYALGDRTGPYAEGRYRPRPGMEVYGSTSAYASNVERRSDVPTFHSAGMSAGGAVALPWKVTLGGSLALLRFAEHDPSQRREISNGNRQVNVSVSAPIRQHSLRVSLIEMRLTTNLQPQTQRMLEIGDTWAWHRLTLGGAARAQRAESTEIRNTVFVRGVVSASAGRMSLYAYLENGNDVVNKSVFTANAIRSTVAGLSAPLPAGWTLQIDAYRNTLNTELNPENIFLFGSSGLGPNTALASSNQWSLYFRVGRQFHWGKLPGRGVSIEEYAAQATPLVGSLSGVVTEESPSGPQGAPNVAIALDGALTAVTDAAGHYRFANVPEGVHAVAMDLEQLPASYDPASMTTRRVAIEPNRTSRADFSVVRLTSIRGRISAPPGVSPEAVVIRLDGTLRYTTPTSDGIFRFANVREGAHVVSIDKSTVPEGCWLASPDEIAVPPRNERPPAAIEFVLKPTEANDKPIRDIPQDVIHLDLR